MTKEERIENLNRLSGTDVRKCMKCGKCSATCPAYDEMEYHPHQFVNMVESGDIEKTRYDSYLRLYEKASQIKQWELK